MVINKFLGGVMNNSFCPLIERKDTTSKMLCKEAMELINHRKIKSKCYMARSNRLFRKYNFSFERRKSRAYLYT